MKYKFKRIKSKWIILVVVVLNILFIGKNPHILYNNGKKFNVRKHILTVNDMLTFVPQDTLAITVYQSRTENLTKIKYKNLSNEELSELYLPGTTCLSINGHSLSNMYYDEAENRVYTVLSDLKGNYEFYTVYDNGVRKCNSSKFYRHPLYEEIKADYIEIGKAKYYQQVIDRETKVTPHKNGYIFRITSEDMNEFYKIKKYGITNNTCINNLQKSALQLGLNLKDSDIYKIIWSHRRNSYFQQAWFTKETGDKGFLHTTIIGREDLNDDGVNDFLISVSGARFINSILLAYDWKNNSIIWEKEFNISVNHKDIKMIDINGDNRKEIIVTTNSPQCENAPDYYDEDNHIDDTSHSYLYILNYHGEFQYSTENNYIFSSNHGFYKMEFMHLPHTNEILFGVKSKHDSSIKQLLKFDPADSVISVSKVNYNSIRSMILIDDKIKIINEQNNHTYEIILNQDLEIMDNKEVFADQQNYDLYPEPVKILDNEWFVSNRFIYDNKHNIITEDHKLMIYENYYVLDNNFYYEGYENGREIVQLEFTHNNKLNPYLLVLFLSEMILLTVWFNTKTILSIPMLSLSSNNIYMFKFFGFFYYWKVTGHLVSRLRFPKGITTKKEEALKLINELSAKDEGIGRKLNFFTYLKVFSIPSLNYLAVIQRLTHDLKNDLMMIKLDSNELLKKLDESENSKFEKSIRTASEKAQMISNFSNISHLNRETTDLNNLVNSVLISYTNHEKYEQIEFISDSEIIIEADRTFLTIGIKNLLNNALEAVDNQSLIFIFITDLDEFVSIDFTNEVKTDMSKVHNIIDSGSSTKPNGSGLGLSIAKSICQAHYGDLHIELKDGVFTASLKLLKSFEVESI